jgi:flagellar biosynthesis protein FlhB
MPENKEGTEKTEPASQKRLSEARMRGQVAKSTDVTTAAVLLIGGMILFAMGGNIFNELVVFTRQMFYNSAFIELTQQNVVHYYAALLGFLAKILLPLLSAIAAVVILAEISQVGFKVASKKFSEGLNFNTVFNPFSGLKRIFASKQSLFELGKNFLKVFFLGIIVYFVLKDKAQDTIGLIDKPLAEIGKLMVSISFELFWKVGLAYIILAFSDFIYQKFRYKQELMMTKFETKEESKQSEGDPKIKSRLRALMRQRMRKMMLKNVRKADVVITNPTHYAVALVYDQKMMPAPKVVAKGSDFLALKIKAIAAEENIPIVEDPPLARAIYFTVEAEHFIPENLFKAVAQVLAYVYHLKQKNL